MAVMAGDSGGSSEALIVASWLSADVDAMCGTDDVTLRHTTENSSMNDAYSERLTYIQRRVVTVYCREYSREIELTT